MKKIRAINLLPIIILFAVFAGGILIYYRQYSSIIGIIKSEYDAKSKLVEESIYNETKYTEIISKIAEKDFGKDMMTYSEIMINKYRENEDIYNWDLENLKEQFDGMDVHIIDRSLEVIRATVSEDVGIDFSVYTDFAETLSERLYKNEFETDSVNFSVRNNDLKKYSYISTPDNKYILELSISISERYPELEKLNIIYLSENLSDKYSFVEDIKIYKYDKDKKNSRELNMSKEYSEKDITLLKNKNGNIKNALITNVVQKQKLKDKNDRSYTAKYIPYSIYNKDSKLKWWNSYVIEVLYDDQVMMNDIAKQKALFLRTMGIMSGVYFSLSYIIIYLLRKNKEIAYQDHLTKLPNRKKFEEEMKIKILNCKRKNNKLAVLFFDLDKFKKINDTLGHTIGDEVLREVGENIRNQIPKGDMLSRLGGDEFIALVSEFKNQEQIIEISKSILESFTKPLNIDSNKIFIKPSIGISVYPDNGTTFEELVEKADRAMYISKKNKIGYKIYDENCV